MSGIKTPLSSSSAQENFDKSRTMMDNLGEHCVECNQLDFLPFVCQKCHKAYCSNHRSEYNEHECVKQTMRLPVPDRSKNLPSSSVWFPDRSQHKIEQVKKNNSILGQLEQRSANDDDNLAKLALLKLKKFLNQNKSFSFKSKLKKSTTTSRIIEVANLKKTAVGDSKIPTSERIYINVQYIPSLEEINNKGVSDKDKKLAIYVSRAWPIGRLLDQGSLYLKIKNENNKTRDVEKKLTIFRAPRHNELATQTEPIYIPANSRVVKEIQDGDLLYIVRGAAV